MKLSRTSLAAEWGLLFIIVPMVLTALDARLVLFGLLWGAAFIGGVYVFKKNKSALQWHATKSQWAMMLIRFAIVSVVLLVTAYLFLPARFLNLPMQRPYLWFIIMMLYPLLSALPQEVLYRAFMHERYRPLFRDDNYYAVASAFAFALAHLIFGNFIALGFAFVGGLLFTHTYLSTKSFGLVCAEHALYGIMVFTSGWGWYFYLGAGHRFF